MKKRTGNVLVGIIMILVLGGSIAVNGQMTKVSTFTSSYLEAPTMEVSASENEGVISLWIDAYSLDGIADSPILSLDDDAYPLFKSNLDMVLEKYNEWSAVAKRNNVTELTKDIPTRKQTFTGVFQYGNDLYFDFSTRVEYEFRVMGSGDYVIIIRTGEMVASSNEYITCDDAVIVLSSASEIKKFIAAVNLDKAKMAVNSDQVTGDLFN